MKPWSVCILGLLACAMMAVHATRLQTNIKIAKSGPSSDKVLLELFVMSRCPDALRVEAQFDSLLERVHEIVEVKFHYIATSEGGNVACKHGQPECEGVNNYNSLWKFVQCQDRNPDTIGDLTSTEDCLKETAPEGLVEKVRQCFSSPAGDGLLRGDVEWTKSLGVTRSCTIFIEHKKRCVMDGNQWYDCPEGHEEEEFVNSICDAYLTKTGKWPSLCDDFGSLKGAAAAAAQ